MKLLLAHVCMLHVKDYSHIYIYIYNYNVNTDKKKSKNPVSLLTRVSNQSIINRIQNALYCTILYNIKHVIQS